MGEYDFNNMELLRLGLSFGGSTFFDIGANIGTYTLISSELPYAQVVSIEPHPTTFVLLRLNVELNARENVLCLNLALSDIEGELPLSDYFHSELNRILKPGEGAGGDLCVPARRFDAICREIDLCPDFIKIDVEGSEQSVLEGFGAYLGEAKAIFIERGEAPELQRMLQSAGYNGPWFCHFRRRVLSKRKQARPEDPIYLGQNFLSQLKEMEFVTA
jgi:FkbM family methyltransferase